VSVQAPEIVETPPAEQLQALYDLLDNGKAAPPLIDHPDQWDLDVLTIKEAAGILFQAAKNGDEEAARIFAEIVKQIEEVARQVKAASSSLQSASYPTGGRMSDPASRPARFHHQNSRLF